MATPKKTIGKGDPKKKPEPKKEPKQKKSRIVLDREDVKQLPVKLGVDELADFAQRLAKADSDVHSHDMHADSVKKDLKAKEQALISDRTRLAAIVRNKSEVRDVRVTVWRDFEKREYREVREDTGEVIYTRPLHEQELQVELFHEVETVEKTEEEKKTP